MYKQIGQSIRRDAEGVKQVAFIGVTNPLDPQVESPEQGKLWWSTHYYPFHHALGAGDYLRLPIYVYTLHDFPERAMLTSKHFSGKGSGGGE